ncbi:tryptophan synthase [Acididesulfobacillus acetoxydans]|uniref:Tryptophan synthase alpha chain n=1 Tax=Acididesulfobacillus acetoxydans TaxID=1561005 RepID=A0A8S0WGP0_9FIRM|nr:tryptophan synthase subunit alpha [Acididesulfobacillus acetoxydans]CAA7602042.1 tryptophan synthase [Acididesulfobacillus acetoxydans]CEJ08115.1 Tryptophan synthase alpha chain [Acididesulfobacillus acetoxydans]
MSERLQEAFARPGRGLTRLIAYLMAGDPDYETSLRRLSGLADAGVDILELGVPFSDPMADGPVIQAAGGRALAAGMRLSRVLAMVRDFRRERETPLLLMSYLNPLLRYGWDDFVREAAEAGVDGLILPDLPWREGRVFRERAGQLVGRRLAFIPMAALTSEAEDIEALQEAEGGFVYVLAKNGITGGESGIAPEVLDFIARLGSDLRLPRCVGFGLRSREQVERLAPAVEGVIVGSALVERLSGLDQTGLQGSELGKAEEGVYAWLSGLWQENPQFLNS